jgi:hypothetical protein
VEGSVDLLSGSLTDQMRDVEPLGDLSGLGVCSEWLAYEILIKIAGDISSVIGVNLLHL